MGILRDVTLHFIRQCFPTLFNRLRVSLSRGHVDSTDVVLSKSDPISAYGIPWQIIDGKVSGLSLQLPWMNHLGAKFSVIIKSVRIHLAEVPFPNLQELVFNALGDEIRRKKFRFVAEVERDQAPLGTSVRHIVSQVLERIDLQVEDCTVVVELADDFIATFRIAKLMARRPEVTSTGNSRTLVVSIQGISTVVKSSSSDVPVPLNIPDFSTSFGIELDGDTLKVDVDVSRIVDLFVHSSLRECVHSLKLRRMQWCSAHKWGRPSSCVRTDASSWMHYAYRRVSASQGLQHVRFDYETLRQSLRSFVEYKNLHVKRLNKSRLNTEDIGRIAELENRFDTDLILLLRHAAKRDVAADEVSQFGKSEWLGWILFGHQMSSERERLTADVRRSLELSSSDETIKGSTGEGGGREQSHCERYKLQCRLNRLSGRLGAGTHDLQISVTGLGFNSGLDTDTGHYKVDLSLEDLLFSVAEEVVIGKQRLPLGANGDGDTALIDASFLRSSDGASSRVHLQSMSVVLQPRIIESCSSLVQQWTSPLLPDRHSQSHSLVFPDAVVTIGNTHVLLFDDRIIYGGKSPALSIILRQVAIRQPPSTASLIPELDASLSLQGSEFDIRSRPTPFEAPSVEDSCVPSDRQQFISLSTDFRLTWTPTARVSFSNAVGFIRLPAVVRVISKLSTSCNEQVVYMTSSEGDEISVHTVPEAVLDTSSIQERFAQSGLQLIVSCLRINVMRGPQPLDHVFTLDMKQWEVALSSPSFFLVSVRIGNIRLSLPGTRPSFLLIEPTSQFQHALRLKRASHPQMGGRFFEVLIGDVSSHLSADALLAATDLVSETVFVASNMPRTVSKVSSPGREEHQSTTFLSLLAASLELRWSDREFHAEINCSDFQVVAEGDKVSGSAETVTLTKVDAKHDTSPPTEEVILHVTDPMRTVNSAIRFLFEPAGIHIDLNNLTAYVNRAFWDPLVLSIADVIEKLQEPDGREKLSSVEVPQSDDTASPIKIDGSGITVILPMPKSEQPQIYADVTRVNVDLQSGLQRLSFRHTAVFIRNVEKDPWRSHHEDTARILQTADFDVQHEYKVSSPDTGTLVHHSDAWELNVPQAIAIALSSQSLLVLRIAVDHLLSPQNGTESAKVTQDGTGTCADSPSAVVEQGRSLFHGSIKALTLTLGFDGRDINGEPFAEIHVKDVRLSTADVRDTATPESCDVAVFTWLASCSSIHLLKYEPCSSEAWRIAIRGDIRRLPDYSLSHGQHGVSVRMVSRQDHGHDTTTYDVRINNVSVLYDPDLYNKLSQFATEAFSNINAVDQEMSSEETTEIQDRGNDHHIRRLGVMSDPSHVPEVSFSGSTTGAQRMASRRALSAKVAVAMANVTLLCLSDEAHELHPTNTHDALHCVTLHIRKSGAALFMSSLMQPLNGSTVRLEGISFCVNGNDQDTKRFLRSTGETQSLENGLYASQEGSNDKRAYVHMPDFISSSAGMPHPNYSTEKLVSTIEGLSATLKHSQEDEMVLSVGNVSLDTSIQTLLRLAEVLSRSGLNSPTGPQSYSYNTFVEPSKLRLHVQCVSVGMSMGLSCSESRSRTPRNRGSMRVDVSISVNSLIDSCSQHLEGTVKMSVHISDKRSGHRDQLVSPCLVRYQLKRKRECTIEAEIKQLLRISFSPLTVRMASALNAALQNSGLVDSTSYAPSAVPETDSRLIVHAHGIAIRCLSDMPRIQVLRLLLGEIRGHAALTVATAKRTLDFSIREFLLEDTVSWRLFRSDPADSSSRRWERIITSIPHGDDGSSSLLSVSPRDPQKRDKRLRTVSLPHHNNGLPTRPALRCHISCRDYFEDLKARIALSGVDVNLDLAALPVILEWINSLVQELPPEDGSRLGSQDRLFGSGESPEIMRREPWFSEVHLEPLTITGGFRAAPRRLQESNYERLLTYILNVDSVTGLAVHLPPVHIGGRHGSLATIVHEVLSTYSYSTMNRQFLWQILAQSQRLSRLARLLVVSLFRQRPYNPLRLSAETTTTVNGNGRPVGLLAALDPAHETKQRIIESSRPPRPLVVHRVGWTRRIPMRAAHLQPPSIHVIDLT